MFQLESPFRQPPLVTIAAARRARGRILGMLDLNDLYYFATLVERGSFTAAAQAIGMPKGTLSRRLAALEAKFELRLIDRTTRRFALTAAGKKLYVFARNAVEQAKCADAQLQTLKGEPSGQVRVTCPQGILRSMLAPLLPSFLARFPKTSVELVASSRYSDLIADGFDIGLRSHQADLNDSSLIARRIASVELVLVASPSYIATRALANPEDIEGHDGLHLESKDRLGAYTLQGPDNRIATVHLNRRVGSDDTTVLKIAAMNGLGIAVIPLQSCCAELADGVLVRVLPEWKLPTRTLSLILPASKGLMPAVRVFADFVIEKLARPAE
jgi:DNA-binding transcriptional LysR family regulator